MYEKWNIKKENGVTVGLYYDEKLVGKINKGVHICRDCANCTAAKCKKVEGVSREDGGIRHLSINKYPFITDGYQVVKNGHLIAFSVTKCNNFKSDKRTIKGNIWDELEILDSIRVLTTEPAPDVSNGVLKFKKY